MRTLVVGKKPASFCFHGFHVRFWVRKMSRSCCKIAISFKLNYNKGASSLTDLYNLKGWTSNPSSWPDLTFGDLYTYLIEMPGIYIKESLKSFKSFEAYQFVISGHVKPLWCHSVGDNIPYCFTKGKVIVSQRNNDQPHDVWVCLHKKDSDGVQSFLRTVLIQVVRFGSLSGNVKKFIPNRFVNRFVQFITWQLTGILSTNPFLRQLI